MEAERLPALVAQARQMPSRRDGVCGLTILCSVQSGCRAVQGAEAGGHGGGRGGGHHCHPACRRITNGMAAGAGGVGAGAGGVGAWGMGL